MLLKTYLAEWLESIAADNGLKPNTVAVYQDTFQRYVEKEAIGDVALSALTKPEVFNWLEKLRKDGHSPIARRYAWKLLRRALKSATKDRGLIPSNPADLDKKIKVPVHNARSMSPEQALRVLKAAAGGPLEAFAELDLAHGFRSGELFALHWTEVDLARGTVRIEWTLVEHRGRFLGRFPPKSEKSRRTIKLTKRALEALRRHRAKVPADEPRVFPGPNGGYMHRATHHKQWKNLLAVAGVGDWKVHEMRHTAATLALRAGARTKVVSEALGHSRASITTDIYEHALPEDHEALSGIMEGVLG